MCVYMYLCVCLCVYIFVYVCLCVCVHMYCVCACLFVRVCVCVSMSTTLNPNAVLCNDVILLLRHTGHGSQVFEPLPHLYLQGILRTLGQDGW